MENWFVAFCRKKDWALPVLGSVTSLLQYGQHKGERDINCNEISVFSMSLVFHLVLN